MKDVEWVEVQPFHQLGAFKWKDVECAMPRLARNALRSCASGIFRGLLRRDADLYPRGVK